MTRICHVIDGLDVGGAEVMLANLLRQSDQDRYPAHVISLTSIGPIGEAIEASGIPVTALGLRPHPIHALRLARLPSLIRATRPDIVQTWLYHADLLGGLAARIASRRAAVIWGVHRSDLDVEWTKRRLAVAAKACAVVSHRVPTRIVCCSDDAARRHVDLGYDADRMLLIPNGFDIDAYAPDAAARHETRAQLGIPQDAPLVGMIARFDPQKDHAGFLQAAELIHRELPTAHFVACGNGVTLQNEAFAALAARHPDLRPNLHALGLRDDIAKIDASLDVGVLSSVGGEAFPLAIGETMASGVPCVVTDVGDAAELVGDTGRAVPRLQPEALARAVLDLLAMPDEQRRALGMAARQRVEDRYELGGVVARYEALYDEVTR